MKYGEIPLSIEYEKAGIKKEVTGFPKLYHYLLDSSVEMAHKKRPAVIICPGGGYRMTSERSGETIAAACVFVGYRYR